MALLYLYVFQYEKISLLLGLVFLFGIESFLSKVCMHVTNFHFVLLAVDQCYQQQPWCISVKHLLDFFNFANFSYPSRVLSKITGETNKLNILWERFLCSVHISIFRGNFSRSQKRFKYMMTSSDLGSKSVTSVKIKEKSKITYPLPKFSEVW